MLRNLVLASVTALFGMTATVEAMDTSDFAGRAGFLIGSPRLGRARDVVLKGCKGLSNGSASDREITVTGGGADCIDKAVKPIDDLMGLGGGDKVCRDPLPNVAGSHRGNATIASSRPPKRAFRLHAIKAGTTI